MKVVLAIELEDIEMPSWHEEAEELLESERLEDAFEL